MIQRLGKYRIIERIGRGGMGMVYKAHDPMLDRTVALKVISSDVDVTDELRARFFREAQACARLSHPNVITVFDMGEEDGQLFIVMEFLEGEELRNLIAQRRNVFLEDKLAIMIEVCDGLDYAHKRGIVHRDIKPGNIFVLRDGHVKLLDFGIARIATADAGLTRTGLVMGTLRYMSPEQARGKVDHRSDIFSVGSVFYELLTYRHAFIGEDPMEILDRLRSEDPELVTEVDPSLPAELGEIIARSLRKDPAQRFPELAHMRVELERLRRGLTDEADQIRSRVRARLDEIRGIQRSLTERIGRSFDDETVPLIDDRIRVSGLSSLERETAAKAERLRELAAKADALAPDLERAMQALEAGQAEEAVQGLERIVAELPDHVHATDALTRAREAVTTARRQAENQADSLRREAAERAEAARREAEERVAAAKREAEERAKREAEERAQREAEEQARAAAAKREAEERERREAEERAAAAKREAEARAAAEKQAAEEKAKREAEERARQAAEQGVAALVGLRRQAEEAGAAEHAATQWAVAEAKAAQARAAHERALHPECIEQAKEAAGLYRAAAEAAQAARQALERQRARAADARRLTVAAGEKAEKAAASTYAADVLSAAGDRLTHGDLAFEGREYESAAQLFSEATREYDRATKVAKDAAAAEARRIEALLAQAKRSFGAGQWAQCVSTLDEILGLPGGAAHAGARELRGRAHAALEAAQRERERIAALLREAEAALVQGDEARCLDLLRGAGEAPAAQEQVAELSRLRRAAEEGIARKQAEAARQETARKAQEEEERKAREAAAEKAKAEAARKAREEEEERKAREAAEHKAREEAARKAREEEERKAREAAEHKAREEAARKAREEEERKAREAAAQRAKDEAARKAQEEAERREAARRQEEERARAEATRREAERALAALGESRKRAEASEASRHAATGWAAAEAKAGESRAAFERGDHAASVARSKEAADLYARTLDAARTALQALERARKQAEEARRQATAARDRAEKAGAATLGGPAWAAAGERQTQATQALERQDHDAAMRLFTEALREYERAAKAAREAAASELETHVQRRPNLERTVEIKEQEPAPPQPVIEEPVIEEKGAHAPAADASPRRRGRRLLPMGIGAGAVAAAIVGIAIYFQTTVPPPPVPVFPTPPTSSPPVATPPPPGSVQPAPPPPAQLDATRREVAEAREAAVIAGAERQAAMAFKAGLQKERAGDAAMKERDWTTADSRYGEALIAFLAAAREATEATGKGEGAAARQRAEAQRARDLTTTARGAAEAAEAPRRAAPAWAKAQESEKIAEAMFKRSDFERAATLYGEALKGYHDAEKQAGDQKRAEAVAAVFREADAAARAARDRSQEAREQARAAGAETLAKDAWTAAAARSSEGDRLLAAGQDPGAARQAFVDSGSLFAEASRRAKVNANLKTAADQSRERMAAEKRRARTDAAEFGPGVAQERQGTQHYERLAFKEANDSFVAATDLFAKAARPVERPPAAASGLQPRDEVRNVLGAYVRAFETKDLTLMQKIRPGLKADEISRLKNSFEGSREYRVSLKVESLDVAGDEAVVRGKREDNLVSKGGQSFRNESPFVFRLKRTGEGWIIDAVN